MTNLKKGKKEKDEPTDEDFQYEVSSMKGIDEAIEVLDEETDKQIDTEKQPKKSKIKIISERDMVIEEKAPPNYSPYLVCFLHYKNSPYKKGRILEQEQQ